MGRKHGKTFVFVLPCHPARQVKVSCVRDCWGVQGVAVNINCQAMRKTKVVKTCKLGLLLHCKCLKENYKIIKWD